MNQKESNNLLIATEMHTQYILIYVVASVSH